MKTILRRHFVYLKLTMCRQITKARNQPLREAAGRRALPLMAAKPPTRPPIIAVTRMSRMDDPPSGNNCATL